MNLQESVENVAQGDLVIVIGHMNAKVGDDVRRHLG